MMTTKQIDWQIDWLESAVTDILKRMEGVEFVAEGWSDIPTHTIDSVHRLTRAAVDLYFDIQDWRERREKPTTRDHREIS